jgi:hypothetical protein
MDTTLLAQIGIRSFLILIITDKLAQNFCVDYISYNIIIGSIAVRVRVRVS